MAMCRYLPVIFREIQFAVRRVLHCETLGDRGKLIIISHAMGYCQIYETIAEQPRFSVLLKLIDTLLNGSYGLLM